VALESATYISDLVSTNPAAGDLLSEADDHSRLIKAAIKASFTGVTGAVTATHTQLNYTVGVTSAIQTQMDLKAALASPTFTGTPTLPTGTIATTQTAGNNTTAVATTAFVTTAVAAVPSGNWVLLKSTAISGTPSTVDFVHGSGGVVISATYDEYMVTFSSVKPTTDNTALSMRTSTDAGVSYAASAGDYRYAYTASVNGVSTAVGDGGTATSVALTAGVGNAATEEGVTGFVHFWAPSAAAKMPFQWLISYIDGPNDTSTQITGGGNRWAAADVDAIRFMFSAGTMTSGTIKLFGRVL
jgi:hypothetical protein